MNVSLLSQETITVKGSDTMVILTQRWAEEFMTANSEVTIQVSGGGSGVGISALINGTTDLCNSSRPMKPGERDKLKKRFGSDGVEIKAAQDGLSVYVHRSNSLRELSVQQLKDIYTGKITNWKSLGGPDAPVVLYGREGNSGTYIYFRDNVLMGEEYSVSVLSLPGTAAVVNAVSKDINGIGYGGAAYGAVIHEVKMKKDESSVAYAPTLENMRQGAYPLSRFLYIYVRNNPTGKAKEFIDWILGDEGQAIVSEVGYYPIR